MVSTGFREGMIGTYQVGFDEDGTITALDLKLVMDGALFGRLLAISRATSFGSWFL